MLDELTDNQSWNLLWSGAMGCHFSQPLFSSLSVSLANSWIAVRLVGIPSLRQIVSTLLVKLTMLRRSTVVASTKAYTAQIAVLAFLAKAVCEAMAKRKSASLDFGS